MRPNFDVKHLEKQDSLILNLYNKVRPRPKKVAYSRPTFRAHIHGQAHKLGALKESHIFGHTLP